MANTIPRSVKTEITAAWIAETTWRVMLLANTYTPDASAHSYKVDVVAHEIVGIGYTANGEILTGRAGSYVDTTTRMLDAADTQWTTATFANVRYAVVYRTSDSKIRFIYDFGSNYSVSSGTFKIQWSSSGLVRIS